MIKARILHSVRYHSLPGNDHAWRRSLTGDPLHLGFSAARAAKVKIKSKHLGAFAANRWPEATFGDQKPLVKGLCDRSFNCFFLLSFFFGPLSMCLRQKLATYGPNALSKVQLPLIGIRGNSRV